MDNMGKEYRNILSNLEEKLKDNPDLEYIKSEFTNLFMLFFNEIDSLRELYEEKIEAILDRQARFDEKINKVEEMTKKLEEEMMHDEQDDFIRSMLNSHDDEEEDIEIEEFEIICPYCGELFFSYMDTIKKEVDCPYCTKFIELDWEELDEEEYNRRRNNEDNL